VIVLSGAGVIRITWEEDADREQLHVCVACVRCSRHVALSSKSTDLEAVRSGYRDRPASCANALRSGASAPDFFHQYILDYVFDPLSRCPPARLIRPRRLNTDATA